MANKVVYIGIGRPIGNDESRIIERFAVGYPKTYTAAFANIEHSARC